MITEDYVSFEVAKLLKDKGFQQLKNNCGYFTTEMVYSIDIDDDGKHHFAHQYPAGVYDKDKYIAAPTHQMAMKWLREVHGLSVEIFSIKGTSNVCPVFWKGNVVKLLTQDRAFNGELVGSYEEAVEAAIKYCLENLI